MILFVATPCYRSDAAAAVAWAARLGRDLGVQTLACCPADSPPWLHVARAQLAGAFKESAASLMLMRDDDVGVPPGVVARMIAADVDAIVAPYVIRDPLGSERPRHDVTLNPDGTVRFAGLGCALVTHAVISRLWFEHEDELGFDRRGRRYVAMFRDFFAQVDGRVELIEEDRAFWYRVAQAGFRIDALDDVEVPHGGIALRYRKPADTTSDGPPTPKEGRQP